MRILLLFLLIEVSVADFVVESPRFKPQSAMIVTFKECNETYSNVYFDLITRKWHVYKYPTCLTTQKDVLSFCQRIYPKLNVVNVYQLETVTRFNLYTCPGEQDHRTCLTTLPMIKLTKPYKCLHGDFREAKLNIPANCQIQHLYGQNECKNDAHWRLLSNEKCKSSGFNLNSSTLLQWCDASTGGISSFSGIEFVCCPPSHSYFPTTKMKTRTTTRRSTTDSNYVAEEEGTEEEDIDDENDEYHDDSVSNDSSDYNGVKNADSGEKSINDETKLTSTISNKVSVKQVSHGSTFSYATLFFLIGFVCTVLLAFIFIRFKRAGGRCWSRHRKDESILINNFNTEDTHVNSMQQNGYENPTYRFFEQSVKA